MKSLQVFIAVAEQGSFSKAADQLGLSQPSVSKQIDKLESSLSVILLKRSTRQLKLTPAGELFYQRAKDISGQLDSAKREIRRIDGEQRQRLQISTTAAIADTVLIDAIIAYQKLDPSFIYKVTVDSLYSYKDSIGLDFDIYLREGELRDSQLKCRNLIDTPYSFYAAPDYLKQYGSPSNQAELSQHSFVGLSISQQTFWMRWIKQDQLGILPQQCSVVSNDTHVLVKAAEQAMGLAIFPYYLAKESLQRGTLVAIDYPVEFNLMPLYALYHSKQTLGKHNNRFLDFLSDYCRQHYLPAGR